ncbi:MAG: hypothetical protein ABID54_07995 [Pseudomonadota bacterium]
MKDIMAIYELRIFKKFKDRHPRQVLRFTGSRCNFNPLQFSEDEGFHDDRWELMEFSFPRIHNYGYGIGYYPVCISANWYTD